MKPVKMITGTMVPLMRSDVDTDQIIPQQFLKRIERTGYGEFLFDSWARDDGGEFRPGFVLNEPARANASVLVAGRNFGCGSSREHAVWALHDWGFEAVVAPSFADIFRNNAVNVGLLPVEMDEETVTRLAGLAASPQATVVIDLENLKVVADGFDETFRIDENARKRLLQGLDPISETLQYESDLRDYEARRPGWLPTTSPL
ncbi:MAG: 3-isopropylmalate dehydratase small subunit [Acidimicrobiia bacterium]